MIENVSQKNWEGDTPKLKFQANCRKISVTPINTPGETTKVFSAETSAPPGFRLDVRPVDSEMPPARRPLAIADCGKAK